MNEWTDECLKRTKFPSPITTPSPHHFPQRKKVTLQHIVRRVWKVHVVFLPTLSPSYTTAAFAKPSIVDDPHTHFMYSSHSHHLAEGTGESMPPPAHSATVSSLRQSDYSTPCCLPTLPSVSQTTNTLALNTTKHHCTSATSDTKPLLHCQ